MTSSWRTRGLPADDHCCGWLALLPPPAPPQHLLSNQHGQAAVIGAGFTGLAVARQLAAHRPDWRIIVVEAQRVGDGAAGRNSGFVVDVPHYQPLCSAKTFRSGLKPAQLLGILKRHRRRQGASCKMRAGLSWLRMVADLVHFLSLGLRSRTSLAAENLFLRKQLAFYQERKVKPRRADNPTRLTLVLLSRWFNWQDALTIVRPRTFVTWHRKGCRLFWRRKSEAGRRPIPAELRQLIRKMARENPSWGEERIANELLLKLGLRVSPRTIRKYMPKSPPATGIPRGDQRWATFLKDHARGIIACDFCVAVTSTFRILYVFVVIEHASRRLIHLNATAHPTAAWTLQQLRDAIPFDHEYRFIIHDHDAIFSAELDASLTRFGLKVINTPVRSPQANSLCERLIGTLRRECLDWIIPLSEGHLSKVLASWMAHYNRGRPHSSLGPGIPDPRLADLRVKPCGHRLPVGHQVVATPILGGLHHEYSLQKLAA